MCFTVSDVGGRVDLPCIVGGLHAPVGVSARGHLAKRKGR